MQYFIKILITTVMVILISEAAKRNQMAGAILAALPTTSIIAITWYYYDTANKTQTAGLVEDIFYMVLPSLIFFIILPYMLRRDYSFAASIGVSSAATAGVYLIFIKLLDMLKTN
ncbi:MAG: DUF3147 family protein [Candidatus Riflebacteria bacterium]|nr:DUF3147 family protein [Candidatus Riflebacteria bacterium]